MDSRVTVSSTLRRALWAKRADGTKLYEIARAAGLHPSVMSALVNDIRPVEPNDPRVLAIAAAVGVSPLDAFTPTAPRGRR